MTALALFRPPDLRADERRFDPPFLAGLERFADDLRPPDLRPPDLRPALLRAGPFLPALFRAGPRFPRVVDLREADFLDDDFLEEDFLEDDFLEEDFLDEAFLPPERVPLFLPPFEPPRDDFLAAAMIRAPI